MYDHEQIRRPYIAILLLTRNRCIAFDMDIGLPILGEKLTYINGFPCGGISQNVRSQMLYQIILFPKGMDYLEAAG